MPLDLFSWLAGSSATTCELQWSLWALRSCKIVVQRDQDWAVGNLQTKGRGVCWKERWCYQVTGFELSRAWCARRWSSYVSSWDCHGIWHPVAKSSAGCSGFSELLASNKRTLHNFSCDFARAYWSLSRWCAYRLNPTEQRETDNDRKGFELDPALKAARTLVAT